ncbi:NAD(P)H-dependent oxidoreductase [Cephaloticoccus primus]|uniref:NAD(P)H-dependent oxidoreductase n=1 Tax=Cephaloticoccus primus TaxID=1548207 RepID=A0A139STV5_9BACT|nr:NAD(P)H-dependent oxidoreductase [Cephaloticoccus primus]KXU37871.1 NAD(P)H-dependent oxidoreductase [Cephaloticoccus primus]
MSTRPDLSPDRLLSALNWRYAVQRFDPTRKVAPETWAALEDALILTPSSYGLQPWRFIVVTDPQKKTELCAAAYNQSQVSDCSHFLVISVRCDLGEDYVDYVERHLARTSEVLGVPRDSLDDFGRMLEGALKRAEAAGRIDCWQSYQAYIALGNFLTSAALLGVDACPMEGFSVEKVDEILGLTGSGYSTAVCVAAGYRAADDKRAEQPKVRFPKEVLFTYL